ncbi:MAG: MOSC domain-containing protein [bacterium]
MVNKGKVSSIRISAGKGVKQDSDKGYLRENHGLEEDIHSGPGERQVSLFARESMEELKRNGVKMDCAGFGENITVSDIMVADLTPGTKLAAGNSVLKITQIGKTCGKPCKFYADGKRCALSTLGVFAAVIKSGEIKTGDEIEVMDGV